MDCTQAFDILLASSSEKSYREALLRFVSAIQSGLDCQQVCYFELSRRQDCLQLAASSVNETPMTAASQIHFSVANTDNPLVYALISAKAYLVNNPYLPGQDEAYLHLMQQMAPRGPYLCYPVLSSTNRVSGVLLLNADSQQLQKLIDDESFASLTHLFAATLHLFQVIDAKTHEAGILHRESMQQGKQEMDKQAIEYIANQLIGQSDSMCRLQRELMQVSRSDVTVMLRGETGVGKDLAALAIHRTSIRRHKPFVVVNCAAIPEQMFEAEFFGYENGAVDGVRDSKPGFISQADGGTLYLDEISSLSLALQAKLLRVLEQKTYFPLGAEQELHSDFRLVTASHQPLEKRVESGEFRSDLFYRINQYMITLPALAERIEDLPALMNHFIMEYMQEHRCQINGFDQGALRLLQQYHFPGNVRELKNLVYKCCLTAEHGGKISEQDIREHISSVSSVHTNEDLDLGIGLDGMVGSTLSEFCTTIEQRIIKKTLQQCAGSRSMAAKKLGIPKRTLAYKCKKWDIAIEF